MFFLLIRISPLTGLANQQTTELWSRRSEQGGCLFCETNQCGMSTFIYCTNSLTNKSIFSPHFSVIHQASIGFLWWLQLVSTRIWKTLKVKKMLPWFCRTKSSYTIWMQLSLETNWCIFFLSFFLSFFLFLKKRRFIVNFKSKERTSK